MKNLLTLLESAGGDKQNQPSVDAAQALLWCDLLGKKEEETHVRAFPNKKSKKSGNVEPYLERSSLMTSMN